MVACSFDWELASKFIPLVTGFITIGVAGFVYWVWHKQKGKEVIANEAKELIKNLLELSLINRSIRYEGSENKEKLLTKILKFNELSNESSRSMLFINKSIESNNLDDLVSDFNTRKDRIYNTIYNTVNNSVEVFQIIDFIQSEFFTKDINDFNLAIENIVNVIHPYSLYKNISIKSTL
jgi:hypothetical protein